MSLFLKKTKQKSYLVYVVFNTVLLELYHVLVCYNLHLRDTIFGHIP